VGGGVGLRETNQPMSTLESQRATHRLSSGREVNHENGSLRQPTVWRKRGGKKISGRNSLLLKATLGPSARWPRSAKTTVRRWAGGGFASRGQFETGGIRRGPSYQWHFNLAFRTRRQEIECQGGWGIKLQTTWKRYQ